MIVAGDLPVEAVAGNDSSRLSGLTLLGGTQGQAIGLGYNPAGQIASRTGSNDAYAFADHYKVDRGYGVNGLNQYTASGSVVPTYDARGNLTSAGGASWVYNAKNQLSGTSGGLLVYDPAGRLDQVSASGLTWEWDGPRLETERSGGAIVRRYVHGAGADEPLLWYEGGTRRWLDADERGSIVRVTNDAGTALAVNRYDEFGIPAAGNMGRFQYTGQMWMPELGLYYYKARMYSPTLGRFLQTDPIGYGDGLNWYDYVGGAPVNATDSSGLQAGDVTKPACPSIDGSSGGMYDGRALSPDRQCTYPSRVKATVYKQPVPCGTGFSRIDANTCRPDRPQSGQVLAANASEQKKGRKGPISRCPGLGQECGAPNGGGVHPEYPGVCYDCLRKGGKWPPPDLWKGAVIIVG